MDDLADAMKDIFGSVKEVLKEALHEIKEGEDGKKPAGGTTGGGADTDAAPEKSLAEKAAELGGNPAVQVCVALVVVVMMTLFILKKMQASKEAGWAARDAEKKRLIEEHRASELAKMKDARLLKEAASEAKRTELAVSRAAALPTVDGIAELKSSGLKAALKALGADAKGGREALVGKLTDHAVDESSAKAVTAAVAKQLQLARQASAASARADAAPAPARAAAAAKPKPASPKTKSAQKAAAPAPAAAAIGKVTVKTLAGGTEQSTVFDAGPSETVGSLKKQISQSAALGSIPVGGQRLVFAGKLLTNDSQLLSAAGIKQ